jgi:hypothetical protein
MNYNEFVVALGMQGIRGILKWRWGIESDRIKIKMSYAEIFLHRDKSLSYLTVSSLQIDSSIIGSSIALYGFVLSGGRG